MANEEETLIELLSRGVSGPRIREMLRLALEDWVDEEGGEGGGGGAPSTWSIVTLAGGDSPHNITELTGNTIFIMENSEFASEPGHILRLPASTTPGIQVVVRRMDSDLESVFVLAGAENPEAPFAGETVFTDLATIRDQVHVVYIDSMTGYAELSRSVA